MPVSILIIIVALVAIVILSSFIFYLSTEKYYEKEVDKEFQRLSKDC